MLLSLEDGATTVLASTVVVSGGGLAAFVMVTTEDGSLVLLVPGSLLDKGALVVGWLWLRPTDFKRSKGPCCGVVAVVDGMFLE